MTTEPLWRQAVEAIDNAISPAVKIALHDETFGLVVAIVNRARRRAGEQIERASRQVLHALNLPAGSDINRLLTQIAYVEREVRDMRKIMIDERQSPC
jgi:hypothetical protein